MSALINISEKYNHIESWFYENFIAPNSLPQKIKILNTFINELPVGSKILDIGCGGCQVIEAIHKIRPDLKITAIDNSSIQIKRGKKRLMKYEHSVDFFEISAVDMTFIGSEFDFVYSLASIKHWGNIQRGILQAMRVLKPGGYLLVTELDRDSSLDTVKEFVGSWRIPLVLKWFLPHIYFNKIVRNSLASNEVVQLFEQLGLEGIKCQPYPKAPAFMITVKKPTSTLPCN